MRKILVTGANKGIGLAIVQAILKNHDDTFVFVGSRDAERGKKACETIGSDRVQVVALDVASDDSVAAAAEQVKAAVNGESLYGIVNNAGIGLGSDALETVLNVNVRGIKRVSDSFLSLLDKSSGRMVNITSASGPMYVAKCDQDKQRFFVDPKVEWGAIDALMSAAVKAGDEADAYGLSKACANSLTMCLAQNHPSLRINACTPGFIETDLTRPYAESSGKSPADLGMKSPEEGTRSAMHLLFEELDGNGWYYGSDAVRSPLDKYRAPGDPPFAGD